MLIYSAFDVVPAPKGASVRIQQMWQALSELVPTTALVLGDPLLPEEEQYDRLKIERLAPSSEAMLTRSVAFAERSLSRFWELKPQGVQFRSLWDGYPLLQLRHKLGWNTPLVYELHGLPEIELPAHFPDLPSELYHKLQRQQQQLLQGVDLILCPSVVHRDYLLNHGINAQRIEMVPNGVNLELFQPTDPIAREVPEILYMGTLAPWQGLSTLLEALQGVRHPFRLRIVGKGQPHWAQALMTEAYRRRLSHTIEWVDPLPQACMPGLIAEADVCVAPLSADERNTRQGCMPLKILEYMAAGRPVLASDLAVTRPLIQNQKTGLLIEADQPEAWRVALEQLLADADLRRELGQAAALYAHSHWDWGPIRQQLKHIWHQRFGL